MRRRTIRSAAFAALATTAALAGCGGVSDTGFEGKWVRRVDTVESVVSIARTDDGGWTFCWDKPAVKDGDVVHRCVAPGRTEAFQGPDAVYAYAYTVEERGGGDEPRWLRVEIEGKPLDGRSTPIAMVDRLELEPGNLTLSSSTIELNGREKPTPSRPILFAKISDDPA